MDQFNLTNLKFFNLPDSDKIFHGMYNVENRCFYEKGYQDPGW